MEGNSIIVYSLAWSADGLLASNSREGVIIWDVEHGVPIQIGADSSNAGLSTISTGLSTVRRAEIPTEVTIRPRACG